MKELAKMLRERGSQQVGLGRTWGPSESPGGSDVQAEFKDELRWVR